MGVGGVAPNGDSSDPVVNSNGTIVAFTSQATNLVAGGTQFPEVYAWENCIGSLNCTPTTLLVSALPGVSPANPIEGNGAAGPLPS